VSTALDARARTLMLLPYLLISAAAAEAIAGVGRDPHEERSIAKRAAGERPSEMGDRVVERCRREPPS
jgi:hypothetical protein